MHEGHLTTVWHVCLSTDASKIPEDFF